MSLRVRLVLALVALSALATVGLGTWAYLATSDRLHHEIDRSLAQSAAPLVVRLANVDPAVGLALGTENDRRGAVPIFRSRDFERILVQMLDQHGVPIIQPASGALPVGTGDVSVAAAGVSGQRTVRNIDLDGEPYRVLTVSVPLGALQVARSLDETDRLLESIRTRILIAVGLVTLAAAVVGWLIARQATRRLVHLTGIAEEVARTGRLDVPVPVKGTDEPGRLGLAFDAMLGRLARSREDQQRLVQDAGHELRTPLTSLRTNISVLRRYDQLPPETRGQVLDDIEGEARELTVLVNELVELATDRRGDEPVQSVSLAEVAQRAAERVRRRTSRPIDVDADDSVVTGRPAALDRAFGNLLENAAKFDSGPGPIELTVRHGRVQVDDRGPGISPADLPRVFDRFYRALDARSQPGSGLGLAIVREIAEGHGGTVFAEARPGGGASVGFVIPVAVPAPGSAGGTAAPPPPPILN